MYKKADITTCIDYKIQGRRPSIVILDSSEKGPSEFTPRQIIGVTRTSSVRLFANAAGERIVIKSPKSPVKKSAFKTEDEFKKDIACRKQFLENELVLMEQAYPDELPYHWVSVRDSRLADLLWSYRLFIPYINGLTFIQYASAPHRNITWLLFFTAIARELQRIHLRGVIHGDIKEDNGLVKLKKEREGFDIHFIDFDSAYLMSDKMAVVTSDTGPSAMYWAPERRVPLDMPAPTPDVKQDVFSYGSMLLRLLRRSDGFADAYPTFFSSIISTQHDDPKMRPELEEVIMQAASCLGS